MVAPIAGRESTRTEKVQLIQPEPQSTDSRTHNTSLIQRLLPIDYREALHQVSTMGSTAIGRPGLRIMLNRKEKRVTRSYLQIPDRVAQVPHYRSQLSRTPAVSGTFISPKGLESTKT